MSILLDRRNRVLVQGITGAMGTFFAEDGARYGTQIVAGVSPGRAGTNVAGVPVFQTVLEACQATGADTAMLFVPAPSVLGAALEAIEAGCRLIVATADELPVRDAIAIRAAARRHGAAFVGPNSPGIISPGKAKMGFMPSFCYSEGRLGVISRSGSLSYECCKRLTLAGIGQSTVIGIGGDPIKGTTAAEALGLFHADGDTDAVLYLGEIGGSEEQFVFNYAHSPGAKPVAALIVGAAAPQGKKMGHAAALIGSKAEGHAAKLAMLRQAGVHVTGTVSDVVAVVQAALSGHATPHSTATETKGK